MFFNFALECAITRVHVQQEGLKLKCTRQILVYASDVNTMGASVRTVKKNTEALVVASKEPGLYIKTERTKCMFMSRDQHAGKNHNIRKVINHLD